MKSLLRSTVMSSVAAVALLFSTAGAQAETPADTLVMAFVIDDIITLDPAEIYEISASEYMANAYDRLVVVDPVDSSKLKPQAAESWSVSDDGKVFTFKIRPGMKFHSGNDVTAEDVEFSLERFVKLDLNPAFVMNQFGLKKDNVDAMVRVVDPMTVQVELDAPYAPSFFLNCLTFTSVVIDKKTALEHEANGDFGHEWLKTNAAGSGAFVFKSWKPNDSLVLEGNPNYWDGAPTMKRVLIKNVTESATQQLLLQKGDIDIARNLTGDQLKAVKNDPNIRFQSYPKSTLWYMGLNTKNEYLGNKDARQAMKYLVDYQGLQDTMFNGTGVIHQTVIPDGQLGADNSTPFTYDLAKAKELLAKAGYPNGFNVTMDVTNKTETRELSASIQNTMAKAGINLIIKVNDNKTTLTKYRASEHDIYLGTWGSDYLDPHSNIEGYLMAPLAKRNQWQSPERDAAVLAARDEKDGDKRVAMYKELQKLALEESPFVILFQQNETAAIRKNVDGFVMGPTFDLNLYKDIVKN